MIVRTGGVTSTANRIVSVATFPAASFATRVTSCPLSDRPANVCEVASRARSTGGAESTDSWRDASPEPESLAVHDTMTSLAFTKVLRAGAVIESEGAFGSQWKGTATSTQFPARACADN